LDTSLWLGEVLVFFIALNLSILVF